MARALVGNEGTVPWCTLETALESCERRTIARGLPVRSSAMHDPWLSLTRALTRTMRDHVPGWTDRNDADPGLTTLELIAYLAENLRARGEPSEGRSSAAARAVEALEALVDREPLFVRVNGERWMQVSSFDGAAPDDRVFTLDASTGAVTFGDGVHGRAPEPGALVSARHPAGGDAGQTTSIAVRIVWPAQARRFSVSLHEGEATESSPPALTIERWSGTTRPNYFSGKVLTADDFREEQQYHVSKHRRHLQMLHGWGVVRGLEVATLPDGGSITVTPGEAVDPLGREIVVDAPVALAPPCDATSPAWLVLEYAERPLDLVSAIDAEPQASRIEEGCRITLTTSPGGTVVTLARLVRAAAGWRVDRTFMPARSR